MDPINDTESKVKYDNDKYTVYIDTYMGSSLLGSSALYNNNVTVVDLLLEGQENVMVRE